MVLDALVHFQTQEYGLNYFKETWAVQKCVNKGKYAGKWEKLGHKYVAKMNEVNLL